MSLRTAGRQNGLLTAALLLFVGWTVLTLLNVAASAGPIAASEWIGQHGIGGVVGGVVLLVLIGFTVAVFGELGEQNPEPEEWPPQ
ncbi:hypothetical protein [Halorubrum laminariae]|uniref:Uncharacterized protein n=1 Tax=Halorubrum laminariae TaxID=1433523 RepID=A0ABD6C0D1_9EURY|nr:hypothetical protein [Halorubrum laminariae]